VAEEVEKKEVEKKEVEKKEVEKKEVEKKEVEKKEVEKTALLLEHLAPRSAPHPKISLNKDRCSI
jgi:hypothetical protein